MKKEKYSKMYNKALETVEKYELIKPGEHIIVGVSGGADSSCLVHFLSRLCKAYGIRLTAVHINHGVRGADALADQQFTVDFCSSLGIVTEIYSIILKDEAKKLKMTEEEAGRHIRYNAFFEVKKKYGADKIAVAHNMNDNAETILMRLCRGTGIKGLGGISVQRGCIIRPLLYCTRADIEEYAEKNNIIYKTDCTNNTALYTRNKIRLQALPWIAENLNPNIIKTLSVSAMSFNEENEYLDRLAAQALELCRVSPDASEIYTDKIKHYDNVIKKRVFRLLCLKFITDLHDLSQLHINMLMDLLNGQSGRTADLAGGISAVRRQTTLLIYRQKPAAADFCYVLPMEKSIFIKEANLYALLTKNKKNSCDMCTIPLNCDKINNDLYIRNRKNGDKIYISSIGGYKRLKKAFMEMKLNEYERNKVPIVSCGDEIVYVYNFRTSDLFKPDSNCVNKIYLQLWRITNENE